MENLGELARLIDESCCNSYLAAVQAAKCGTATWKRRPAKVKCVVISAVSYGIGGLERVVCEQCKLFQQMGLSVHLVLSSALPERHYPLPRDVELHFLPFGYPDNAERVMSRVSALLDIVKNADADIYLDSAYLDLSSSCPPNLWDWIGLRLYTSVRMLLHWHSVFSRFVRMPGGSFFAGNAASVAALCDGVITLSRVDALFFRTIGFNAVYIPNPVDEGLQKISRDTSAEGKRVLWCGRLVGSKRPLAALRVIKAARMLDPEIELDIVGGGDDRYVRQICDYVRDNGLQDVVRLHGESTDVYRYYRTAKVFLSTSEYEGYPMTFLEATAFGLPIVCLGKPYLELLRENDGAVTVAADDVEGAGAAIAGLFRTGTDWNTAHERTVAAWNMAREFDFALAYEGIFTGSADDRGIADVPIDDLRLMQGELTAAFSAGFEDCEKRWLGRLERAGAVRLFAWLRRYEKLKAMVFTGSRTADCLDQAEWYRRVSRRLRGKINSVF